MMGAMVVARVSARAVHMVDGKVVARVVLRAYARKLLEVSRIDSIAVLWFGDRIVAITNSMAPQGLMVMVGWLQWLILMQSLGLMVGWLL